MDIGKRGLWCSTNGLDSDQLGDLARRAEGHGYGALWYPESLAYEAMALGGYLLSKTEGIVVATGIANIYARDAVSALQGHNTLNALHSNWPRVHPGNSDTSVAIKLTGVNLLPRCDRSVNLLAFPPSNSTCCVLLLSRGSNRDL